MQYLILKLIDHNLEELECEEPNIQIIKDSLLAIKKFIKRW